MNDMSNSRGDVFRKGESAEDVAQARRDTFERLEKLLGTLTIRSDRQLLAELGMSDALAAAYLSKSRQALNFKLGPKREKKFIEPYFKIADLLVLLIAARQRGHEFNRKAIWEFILHTGKVRPGTSSDASMSLIEDLLKGPEDVDVSNAKSIALILPDFMHLRSELPDFSEALKRLTATTEAMKPAPWLVVISSTNLQAEMAAEWLDLPEGRTKCFADEIVDHYVPSVLVFPTDGSDPRPYMLTECGTLIPAPHFRARMMAQCVRMMVPAKVRSELFAASRNDEDRDEVKRNRRA